MKKKISAFLKEILKKEVADIKTEEIENRIEIPPSGDMGDFAFPCFFLSKKLRKNPNEIAENIKNKLGKTPKFIDSVNVSGGYINFFLNKELFAEETVKKIISKKENFGKANIGKGKKALIEHTSINPNASPHVGRARNAIIGDSLVKILRFVNFKPEVHYYVNDISKQIAMLVLANAENLKFEQMLKRYVEISKKVSKSQEMENKVFELLLRFESKEDKTVKKFKKITNTCVIGQKRILSEMGIHYDFFDYESKYISKSKKILEDLIKTGKVSKDKEGRFVLNLEGSGIENKMKEPVLVLTRSDGTGLYLLRDIVYTLEKMEKSKTNIVVLGEEQKLYFDQLSYALKLLEKVPPRVVHYSFILLNSMGTSKKMSTRKGDIVLLEDFLNEAEKRAMKKSKNKKSAKEVSIAAVKYSILKNHPNKSINFSLEDSLNFEGNTGPYLLYTYARANSILKKSKIKSKTFLSKNLDEKEFELVKILNRFEETILNSYKELNPSIIANYSYELAKIFNEFYHSTKVLGSEDEKFKLAMIDAFKITLKNSLYLLGINAIDRM